MYTFKLNHRCYIDKSDVWLICATEEVQVIKSTNDNQVELLSNSFAVSSLIELTNLFETSEFWNTFLSNMALEVTGSLIEFSKPHMKFFKYFFQLFEDTYLDKLRINLKSFAVCYNDKWKQKAASQIMTGLLRGMKYWSAEKTNKVWVWCVPLIRGCFQNATLEGSHYWRTFLRGICVLFDQI